MLLSEIISALDEIAPLRYAESWDNVGLLIGDRNQQVSKAILTIDYTDEVAAEAQREQCDFVIAYHPPIFQPVKQVTAPSVIFDALRRGVAIYSPHTALDVAPGGTNDMLAEAIGIVEARPLRMIETKARSYKLVTFVPEDAVEKVSSALFGAGAGRIGNYSRCSFRSHGTGTFYGDESTKPTVGKKGKLEQAAEIRLETVLPIARLSDALAALKASHPYEEPAFDLVQLAAPPEKLGQGRIGSLSAPTARESVIARIKKELSVNSLLIAGPTEGNISKAACCAGACGDLLNDALTQKAELYLTGEMRHHDALKAARAGMTVVCTLHSNSERAVLKRLAAKISAKFRAFPLHMSQVDRDPFVIA